MIASIKKPRLLFIPNPMPSHLIPLIYLAKLLNKKEFESAFLVPKEFHEHVRELGFTVIDIDRSDKAEMRSELTAIQDYQPDILVDDLNYFTAYTSRIMMKPRISIVRKGIIPFEKTTPGYGHSSGLLENFEVLKKLDLGAEGFWSPQTTSDLFIGDINIIPSIPSIEVLPAQLENNPSYYYSGPLILDDQEMCSSGLTFTEAVFASVADFFNRHEQKKLVYFTVGLGQPAVILKRAAQCIQLLLNNSNIAVLTNVPIDVEEEEKRSRYFTSGYLPMHEICSRIDLMIHQCGSGTYNYQLYYEVPGIVLGSRCYDRDDIGMRLEELGAVCFINADLEEEAYYTKFSTVVGQLLNNHSSAFVEQKLAIAALKDEMMEVKEEFNFPDMIRKLLAGLVENRRGEYKLTS